MGQKLASTLNRLIDAQESESISRADIILNMASAVEIDTITVNEILRGAIDCPPIERLQGFARVLNDASVGSLLSAAEADGCNYVDRVSSAVPIREVISKEQYLRLQQISEELERAIEPGSSLDS